MTFHNFYRDTETVENQNYSTFAAAAVNFIMIIVAAGNNFSNMQNKVIIFSAPSGSGKSTIVNHILGLFPELEFSISATSRAPRGSEKNGREYYFFSKEEFRKMISENKFVEYEEVYSGSYYGTLKSELDRIWSKGHVIIFDVDVKGGVNLKRIFGEQALSVFIRTTSVAELRRRLIARGTDSMEAIEKRVAKAAEEMTFAEKFDCILVNDVLDDAFAEAEKVVGSFIRENRSCFRTIPSHSTQHSQK